MFSPIPGPQAAIWTTAQNHHPSFGIFWSIMRPSRATPQKPWTNTFWICAAFSAISSWKNGLSPRIRPWNPIPIDDVDIQLIRSVTLTDVYAYMSYLSRDRAAHPNSPDTSYGLSASSRARKVATIRSFYKYLTNKAKLLTENPMQDLDSPASRSHCPVTWIWKRAWNCWSR